jgi:hypothetical protein
VWTCGEDQYCYRPILHCSLQQTMRFLSKVPEVVKVNDAAGCWVHKWCAPLAEAHVVVPVNLQALYRAQHVGDDVARRQHKSSKRGDYVNL